MPDPVPAPPRPAPAARRHTWPRALVAALLLAVGHALTPSCSSPPRRSIPPRGGVLFDGSGAYAVVQDAGGTFDAEALTFAVWLRPRDRLGRQILATRGERDALWTLELTDEELHACVELADGTAVTVSTKRRLPGLWAHVAMTFDGERLTLYRDGDHVATTAAVGRLRHETGLPLVLGAEAPSKNAYHGALDDLRFWNRALSAGEVRRVASGDDSVTGGLLGWWLATDRRGMRWPNRVVGDEQTIVCADADYFAASSVRLADGFRGIWYSNQPTDDDYVYKYAGGFATYPQQHVPIAVHSPIAQKTFFVFGARDEVGRLVHAVSYFDHADRTVARPRILLDKNTTDAHDNPTLMVDGDGYIWVFSNAHGTARPSYVHRSRSPHSIDSFELVRRTNFSYGQPWWTEANGWCFLHTLYDDGKRILHFQHSVDGRTWGPPLALAKLGRGHYQISWRDGNRIATAFNVHPQRGGLNARTNLYYLESDDGGRSWRSAAGRPVMLPINRDLGPTLAVDEQRLGNLVYLKDLNFDVDGSPVVLYLTSRGWRPGPDSGERTLRTARWTGAGWVTNPVTTTDHNYDHGSLWIERLDDERVRWRVIAPTDPGPQPHSTGGEVVVWDSLDQGATWTRAATLTADSEYNHTYVRRPVNAHPDFWALWADGDAKRPSDSRLYFTDREASAVWRLPTTMRGSWARPVKVE